MHAWLRIGGVDASCMRGKQAKPLWTNSSMTGRAKCDVESTISAGLQTTDSVGEGPWKV